MRLCVCKLQNNCSCLICKQDPSSDHTAKDPNPSEDRNGNCSRTGGIPTRKGGKRYKARVSEYWCTSHASTNNHSNFRKISLQSTYKPLHVWGASENQRVLSTSSASRQVARPQRDTIRYDTRCYFSVRSKANTSQLYLRVFIAMKISTLLLCGLQEGVRLYLPR